MNESEKSLADPISHEEVLQRFDKVFGREMTDAERLDLFMPSRARRPRPIVKEFISTYADSVACHLSAKV